MQSTVDRLIAQSANQQHGLDRVESLIALAKQYRHPEVSDAVVKRWYERLVAIGASKHYRKCKGRVELALIGDSVRYADFDPDSWSYVARIRGTSLQCKLSTHPDVASLQFSAIAMKANNAKFPYQIMSALTDHCDLIAVESMV